MGQNINLKCKECGNAVNLQTGQGIRDNRLDTVLGYFDEEAVKKILHYFELSKRLRRIKIIKKTAEILDFSK